MKQLQALLILSAAVGILAGQTNPPASLDRSAAYYHYALGHYYGELAGAYQNRGDYLNRAIESYRQAMKEDPSVTFIAEELSDLYIQSGKLRDGVLEAEEVLRQNPSDLNARRLLARIYTRLIGEAGQGRIDETMLSKAIEQYQKIAEADPKNPGNWIALGGLYKVGQKSPEALAAYQHAIDSDPENEDAMTGKALVYADLGQTKDATELLRKVADRNPSPQSLTRLAGTYEVMREFRLAADALRKAIDLSPGSPNAAELQRALAQDLLLSDNYADALKLFQQFALDDPKDAQAQVRLSQIYRQMKDFKNAHIAADRALQLDPNGFEVRYNQVGLLEAEGDTKGAIATLNELLAALPKRSSQQDRANRITLLERLGVLNRSAENYPAAVASFRAIVEVDPETEPKAMAQIVETYRQAKQYDKAVAEADAAAKKYPKDRLLRSVRSSALSDAGRTSDAAADLKALLSGGKDDRETYLALAQVYDKARDYPQMAAAIDSADKLSVSNDEKENIHFMRGVMLERQKKFEPAEVEFRAVLDLNPENASALNYLGYMLADRNIRLSEAEQLISRALSLEPNNGAYLDSLGWAYFRLGRLADAEKFLVQAAERYSKDPTVHNHLGDVLFRQGRLREAIVQWQSSVNAYRSAASSEQDPTEFAEVQRKLENAKTRLAREGSSPKPSVQ